jgi:hypothetical protein
MATLSDWAKDHPKDYLPGDSMLAASFPHSESIDRMIHDSPKRLSPEMLELVKADAISEMETWKKTWLQGNR